VVPDRDEALVVPVRRTADEPDGELLPQESKPTLITRRPDPVVKAKPGDLICAECGDGNPSTRKFCHRCGHSLRDAVVAKLPWYRRVLRHRRRGAKVLPAGTRPAQPGNGRVRKSARDTVRILRRGLWVVLLVAGLATAAYPPLRTMVMNKFTGVKEQLAGVADQALSPVRPATVTATAQLDGHPGGSAFDTFANTYWAAPWSRDQQPSLTVDLGKPGSVVKVIVTSGAKQDFTATNRPSIVNLAYSNEKSDTITLRDTPEPQELVLPHALGAQTVRIQVLDVYPATTGDQSGTPTVSITEIELFTAL
jgi:hypothetical protein